MIVLPPHIQTILNTLRQSGFEAYVVGGCVRDALLGITPCDWDVATSALPGEIKACFSHTADTGLKHGTVSVVTPDTLVEVTTYRIDGDYINNRSPASVEFTKSLTEDLSRRDFTVNAMAYSPESGIVDVFGGQEDLSARLIRAVGDPAARFAEDALRIMRMFRFNAQLGFDIAPETLNGAATAVHLIRNISAERIAAELNKTLTAPAPSYALRGMVQTGVMEYVVPEFMETVGFDQRTPYHDKSVDEHILESVDAVPCKLHLRLAMLFHDIGKPRTATMDSKGVGHFFGHGPESEVVTRAALTRLKYPAVTIEYVCSLVKYHDAAINPTTANVKRWLGKRGEEWLRDLLLVKRADNAAKPPVMTKGRQEFIAEIEEIVDEVLRSRECFSLASLAVTGDDLMGAGIPQGPRIGEVLQALLGRVMEQPELNEKDVLLKMIRNI